MTDWHDNTLILFLNYLQLAVKLATTLSRPKEFVYSMGGAIGRGIPPAKPAQLVHFRIKLVAAAVVLVVLSTEQYSRVLHQNEIVSVSLYYASLLKTATSLVPFSLVQLILSCWSAVLKGLGVRSPLTAGPTDLQPPLSAPLMEDYHISVSNSTYYELVSLTPFLAHETKV